MLCRELEGLTTRGWARPPLLRQVLPDQLHRRDLGQTQAVHDDQHWLPVVVGLVRGGDQSRLDYHYQEPVAVLTYRENEDIFGENIDRFGPSRHPPRR